MTGIDQTPQNDKIAMGVGGEGVGDGGDGDGGGVITQGVAAVPTQVLDGEKVVGIDGSGAVGSCSGGACLLEGKMAVDAGGIPSDPVLAMQMGARMALSGETEFTFFHFFSDFYSFFWGLQG